MQIDWFTFLAQIVNFLILILLLRRFLYKPVISAMDRREEGIAGRLEEARLKMVEASEKESEYERKLKEFDQHKEQMLQQAKEEVDQEKKEMMAEARSQIDALKTRWNEALAGEQQAFLQELQIAAGNRIVDIIQEILADLSTKDLDEQVTAFFIKELASIDREENKKMITAALDYGEGVIEVKSSFEIGEEQKHQIKNILQDKVAPQVECRFDVVPALGFGIEIRAGGWRAGWNLNGYIGRLRQDMERAFAQNVNGSASNTKVGKWKK